MEALESNGAAGDQSPRPVADSERIAALDLIRGVSVLGILLVNINSFALPSTSFSRPYLWGVLDKADQIVFALNYVFIQNKFYSLFSLLFGAGLILQSERLERRGEPSVRILVKRLLILILFGFLHAALVWRGDILFWYGAVGLLVLLMRGMRPRYLLAVGIIFLTLPMLVTGLPLAAAEAFASSGPHTGLAEGVGYPATQEMAEGIKPLWDGVPEMISESPTGVALEAKLYGSGNYLEITAYRMIYWFVICLVMPLSLMWPIWGYMLVGAALMKAKVFHRVEELRARLGTLGAVGFFLGLGVTALGLPFVFDPRFPGPTVANALLHYGALGLTVAYLFGLLIISRSELALRITLPFRAAGRMAFTNYLMQSVLFTWFFYGYGLGRFGEYGYAELTGFVVAMWVFQLSFSTFWLRVFRYGPMEWVWRRLTYGAPLAWRRRSAS